MDKTIERDIRGPRRDLRGVRGAEHLKGVFIRGRGIKSLAGIEHMRELETLTIERLIEPELELLASLPRLRHLYLEQLRGDLDFDVLEGCRGLRHLAISFPSRHEALRMTARLEALQELEYLHLSLFDPSSVAIDLAWVPANPNLRDLYLFGFVPAFGRYEELEQATQLEALTVTTDDEALLERLAAKLAPIDLSGYDYAEDRALHLEWLREHRG